MKRILLVSDQDQMEMEHLNPKGPEETQEEMEEEQLDGSGGQKAPQ